MVRVTVTLLAIALATGCGSGGSTDQADPGRASVDAAPLDRVTGWDSIGAFERTPVETDAPALVLDAAQRQVTMTSGGEHEAVLGTLRKLRSGLGRDEVSIYALRRSDGLPCIVVWRRSADCAGTVADAGHPGVLWMLAAGYPAWARADGVPVPSALVGLVLDEVRAVTFVGNGSERPVEIVNNTFYGELEARGSGSTWDELRIEYASGMTRSIPVPTP
jgi:hypothetical protein